MTSLTREQTLAVRALGFCDHPRRYVVAMEPARIVVCLECGGVEEADVGPDGHLAGTRRWRFPTRMEQVCEAFHEEIVGPRRDG